MKTLILKNKSGQGLAGGQVKLTTKGLFSFSDLMPGAQASGAQVESFRLAIDRDSDRVYIG